MDRVARGGVKGVLAFLILMGLLLQALIIPLALREVMEQFSELGHLYVPILVWAILIVLCAQTVLVIVWRLTTMTASEAIFTERAFTLVRVMIVIGAIATGLLVAAVIALNVFSLQHAIVTLGLVGGIAIGVGFCLLLVTMRGLLRRAADLSDEMAQVV